MTARRRPIRILVAKPGLDGHDRGAKVVAAALRDAGMEVIYTGLHQTPEMIVQAAVQEDVDVVGLSILSGAHLTLFPRVKQLLVEAGRDDVLVTGGGIIPPEDMETLRRQGVGDRKSTRLNSSHVEIAYAVFCLKKKKKRKQSLRCHNRIHDARRHQDASCLRHVLRVLDVGKL